MRELRWYTLKMGMALPEGLSASQVDTYIYRALKYSDLEYDVEEILEISEYDETNAED